MLSKLQNGAVGEIGDEERKSFVKEDLRQGSWVRKRRLGFK